jgi:hypothetical protein
MWRQWKVSPLTTLNASFAAVGDVAAQARCRPRSRASVMSVVPSYCSGDPGKTNGRPVSLAMVP